MPGSDRERSGTDPGPARLVAAIWLAAPLPAARGRLRARRDRKTKRGLGRRQPEVHVVEPPKAPVHCSPSSCGGPAVGPRRARGTRKSVAPPRQKPPKAPVHCSRGAVTARTGPPPPPSTNARRCHGQDGPPPPPRGPRGGGRRRGANARVQESPVWYDRRCVPPRFLSGRDTPRIEALTPHQRGLEALIPGGPEHVRQQVRPPA